MIREDQLQAFRRPEKGCRRERHEEMCAYAIGSSAAGILEGL